MKHVLLTSVLAFSLLGINAQTKTPVKTTPKAVNPLKNLADSASYAVGVSVANFYKQQGVKSFNTALVTRAINDVLGGKKALLDDGTTNMVMNNYISRLQAEKSKPTIAAGQKFLAANKVKPGIKTTPSGLQYEVLFEGGGERPGPMDSVTCHYRGTFINGTEFEASYNHGQPITFSLNGVIPGWTEGLQLMTKGSKYKFYIPYTLGYGAFDYNAIPGGSALVFEIELLGITKKQ